MSKTQTETDIKIETSSESNKQGVLETLTQTTTQISSKINSKINLQSLSQDQFFVAKQMSEEYQQAMLSLNSLPSNTVTFYGGSRVPKGHHFYEETKKLASGFAQRGWGVITGGGPGIMTAGLEGAKDGSAENGHKCLAIAYKIHLPAEPIFENSDIVLQFNNFPPRKYALRQSDVLVFAPGGMGTLDELMENLTLIQTNNYPVKPIYLLDKEFWHGLMTWVDQVVVEKHGLAGKNLHSYYKIMDTAEEVLADLFG